MGTLISIIMPAYNCEKTIGGTISSVLAQEDDRWELIIIDDGSTDHTSSICDSFAMQDKRISVIHQFNSGVSAARNTGIDKANGDFIVFIDSDDYFVENTLKTIIQEIEDNGLLIFGYETFPNIIEQRIQTNKGYTSYRDLALDYPVLARQHLINSPWNKLYRTELIRNYSIRFPEELSMGEDLLFNIDYLKICGQIKVINDILYKYRIDGDNSLRTKARMDAYEIQKRLKISVDEIFDGFPDTIDYSDCEFTGISIGIIKSVIYSQGVRKSEKMNLLSQIIYDNVLQKSNETFLKHNDKMGIVSRLIRRKEIFGIYLLFRIRFIISSIIRR